MPKVLGYHHLLAQIKRLITDYYDNYTIFFGTDNCSTEPVIVGKVVLPGHCLSPLLFNMIVNALIKSIDHEKVCCMGYSSSKTLLHVTGFNLLMIRLSQHKLKKITNCS